MAKKRKGKHVSKRGHKKEMTIRYREKLRKEIYRIDEEGKRIDPPAPINTFSAEWLAKCLAGEGGKPPVDHSLRPPPDNVTSLFKPKALSVSGNEAEQRDDPPDKGKRLEFDSPPSVVHNPFIKPEVAGATIAAGNKRIRMRQGVGRPAYDSKTLAPSLTPIWVFTKGPFKPTKNPVVYTTAPPKLEYMQEWPFVRPIVDPPAQLNPSWEWDKRAANDEDNTVKVRRTSSVAWASKMNAHVQWFINNVEVQYWPGDVLKFAHWKPGADGPVPNTGAINKAAAYVESSATMLNGLYEGLEASHRDLDERYGDATSKIAILERELELTQEELRAEKVTSNYLAYDTAARTGVDPDTVRDNIIKAKTPDVPDDADEMLAQFNVYQSFVKCDGPEHAFARYVYGDPRLGEVIRDHADMKFRERMHLFNEREALRRIGAKARQANMDSGYVKYPEIRRYRAKAGLYRLNKRLKAPSKIKYSDSIYYRRLQKQRLEYDAVLFSYWGNRVTSTNRKRPVNYKQVIEKTVGVRHTEHINATAAKLKWSILNRYRLIDLEASWKGKTVKFINKAIDILNTEVNPVTRGDMARERELLRKQKEAARKAKAERKAEQKAAVAKSELRIKHAAMTLEGRGFVIVDR